MPSLCQCAIANVLGNVLALATLVPVDCVSVLSAVSVDNWCYEMFVILQWCVPMCAYVAGVCHCSIMSAMEGRAMEGSSRLVAITLVYLCLNSALGLYKPVISAKFTLTNVKMYLKSSSAQVKFAFS